MNTKQLHYVLTLANEGSFSKAADVLNISQPSLSQFIKKIELDIGQSLFDRSNNDVRLTDAGKAYLQIGRQILDLEHQLEEQLADLSQNKTGSLIIGAAPFRTASMMPEVAKRFQQLHPGMHLVVREGTTAELVEGMEHGEYDLCLTMMPIDQRLFSFEPLVEEELVLAVPKSFPEFTSAARPDRKYAAVDASQLNGSSFVMLTDSQYMQTQLHNLCLDYHLELKTAAIVKSLEAQIEMVKMGLGMALMPTGIERFCHGGEVRFYSFLQELPKRQVVVMWRKDRTLSKVAEELKDVICSIPWDQTES